MRSRRKVLGWRAAGFDIRASSLRHAVLVAQTTYTPTSRNHAKTIGSEIFESASITRRVQEFGCGSPQLASQF